MARMATYECTQCGTKVDVTEAAGGNLQPIYCCGMEVARVTSIKRKLAAKNDVVNTARQKAGKKSAKTVIKKGVSKSTPAAKSNVRTKKKVSGKK